MENMADALKIAFGVLVFVIAITITFSLLSTAKQTTDSITYMSDKTNYYEHYIGDKGNNGRIVGLDTVIASIYRAWRESYAIKINLNLGEDIIIDTDNNYYANSTDFRNKINDIIKNKLINYNESKFIETFDNVAYTGEYIVEDEEKITITPGYTKTYIYYTLQL